MSVHQRYLIICLFWSFLPCCVSAQNRIHDPNLIGWYAYFGDHKLSDKWAVHTEYQWRRIDLIRTWQQSLARVGLQYSLTDRIKASAGYTLLLGFPYGRFPESEAGVPNPEHRIYQDLELEQTAGRLQLTHRFRLEQRWMSNWSDAGGRKSLGWQYQNRARYRIRGALPLGAPTMETATWYATAYDELFIGFGPNVQLDVFDQNRIFLGLGYQFSPSLKLEGGFLNQLVQHAEPDPATGLPVLERNNGVTLSVYWDLDFRR